MPYIQKSKRPILDPDINSLIDKIRAGENQDGEGNYTISRIVAGIFKPETGRWRYYAIARAIGCFVCAALEFYWRVGRKVEDKVIESNGDIEEYEH
jgi:hypothetical protein